MKVLLVLLASLAAFPAVVADTTVVLTDGSCDSPWDVTSISSTCGDNACGTIEVSSAFDAETEVTVTVTMFYYKVANEQVNVCDYIEPLDGQECGEEGTYSIDTTITIPYDNVSSWLSYMTVKVTMQDITTCTLHIDSAQSSSAMSMAAAVLVGALVVAGIFSVRRRRRRRVENESLQWTLTDFEMPPEGIRRGVQV